MVVKWKLSLLRFPPINPGCCRPYATPCLVDRHWCPWEHFSMNRTTGSPSPVTGPNVAPAWPVFSFLVTRGHPLSSPGGVQRAAEFGRSAQCNDHPTFISQQPTITCSLSQAAPTHIVSSSNNSFQCSIFFSATVEWDQGYRAMDKANIFAHHLLMCSALARIDYLNWPRLDTFPHLISPNFVCKSMGLWDAFLPCSLNY